MTGRAASKRKAKPRWSVYLIRCKGGALYTGIATDVARRLAEHRKQDGRGSKYLRGKGPLRLMFQKKIGGRSLASKIEARIKKLPKAKKERLIKQNVVFERLLDEERTRGSSS